MNPNTPCKNFRAFPIYLVIFYFLVNSVSIAGSNPKKKTNKWLVNFSLSSIYDDNILKNSEKYTQRFLNREDEGRFHINRYDDLIVGYNLGVSFTEKILPDLKSIFSIGINYNTYTYNSIKTWSRYIIGWRQYVARSTSIKLSYSYIPNFYVRHFRDDDWIEYVGYTPEAFQPYEFAKDDFSLWFQHNIFKSTRARLYFSYMRYFHNEHYTEYDSDNFLYGFRVYQTLSKKLTINAGYKYVTSDIKNLSKSEDDTEPTSIVDATYNEHIYLLGIKYNLPSIFGLKNNISINGQYFRRFYRTDNFVELDLLHAGRFDYNYRIYFNYGISIYQNFSVSAIFNWLYRDSQSASDYNDEYISDEKDYSQYQLGLKFNYKLNF